MAVTGDVTVTTKLSITDNQGGAVVRSFSKTYSDVKIIEWDVDIAASTTASVWKGTGSPTPTTKFDYLYLKPTVAVEVKVVADTAGGSPRNFAFTLDPNKPFELGDDASRDNSNADSLLAAAKDINEIIIKESAGVAGTLHILMLKA